MENLLKSKTDNIKTDSIIVNKVDVEEFENLKNILDNIYKDLTNKLDYFKFQEYINDTYLIIEEIKKELMIKSNIKEMISLLNKKSDIDKVNNALIHITEDLDLKCSVNQVCKLIKLI